MIYFDKPGKENTNATLEAAFMEADKRNIGYIIAASTTGDTGLKLAKICSGSPVTPIIITHNTGFKEPGVNELKPEYAEEIKSLGGIIYTGTLVLRNAGSAIRMKFGYSESELINAVLRMFCQGIKVCVEMAAMASDAGLIPVADIIAVAGTGYGADTAAIIWPQPSHKFFDIKVKEIIAKPSNF